MTAGAGEPGALRTAGTLVAAVVERSLLRPLREGRLRFEGPRAYTTTVVLAVAGVALALLVVLLAPVLRSSLVLVPTAVGVDAPSEPVGLLTALLVLAVALVHTAALHAPVGGRVAGLVLALIVLGSVATLGYDLGPAVALTAYGLAVAALIGLQALRWRSRSAWWELPVVLAIYAGAVIASLSAALRTGAGAATGRQVETLWLLLTQVAYLATPVVLVASVAIAQLGLRAASWSVRGIRVLTPGWLALAVCVLLLGYRVVVDLLGWIDTWEGSGTRIAGAAGLLVACALAWGLTGRLGRRAVPRPLAPLLGDLTSVAIPLAAVVAAGQLLELLVSPTLLLVEVVARGAGETAVADGALAAVGGARALSEAISSPGVQSVVVAMLLAGAAVLAVRGWRGPSGFVAVLAVVLGAQAWWGLEVPLFYLPLLLTGLGVLALVALLVAGRLSLRRLEALTLLALLTTLLGLRDVVGEALALAVGATGAVVVALVWAFATGGGATVERTGRRGRAMWFLGYSLLGFTVLAFAAIAGTPDAAFDAEATSQRGDELFGTALLVTAALACLGSVVRDRDLGELS